MKLREVKTLADGWQLKTGITIMPGAEDAHTEMIKLLRQAKGIAEFLAEASQVFTDSQAKVIYGLAKEANIDIGRVTKDGKSFGDELQIDQARQGVEVFISKAYPFAIIALSSSKVVLHEALIEGSNMLDAVRGKVAIATGIVNQERAAALHNANDRLGGFFRNEAARLLRASYLWLSITSLLGVGIGFLIWCFIEKAENVKDGATLSAQFYYLITARIFALGVTLAALCWSARTFRLLQHLANTYTQKAVSAETMMSFATAVGDDKVLKTAIISEASRSVFTLVDDGFAGEGRAFFSGNPIDAYREAKEIATAAVSPGK